ncbi:MAG: cobalamin-dependent protein [Anaerolineae bacterium]|jgi:methanogenic corrinoid protein MtbC1|nr:cobalamin-dependent protein [Anaerolineae bacterium]
MAEEPRFNGLDDTPVYTIKTVVQETGIAPATLRAWERRYGVLSPGRSDGGYRLYSERDISTLRWLKNQVDAGVSISRAVALLEIRHQAGEEPELELDRSRSYPASENARGAETIVEELVETLLAFQEPQAENILGEAFALYPVDVVAEEIVAPTLVEIGERWHRGEATVVQEHFATAFLRRRLTALFHAYPQPLVGPLAITGSAPAEWHDVGILLVSMALRRHGWRVIYLGQNVPGDHLLREVRKLKPDMVCLSASTRDSAGELVEVHRALRDLGDGRPRLILGGRVFGAHPEFREHFAGAEVVASARELVSALA